MESSYLRLTARAASQHGAFNKGEAAELGVTYRVLRFSAWDVMAAPEYVTSQIVAALAPVNSLPASKFGG